MFKVSEFDLWGDPSLIPASWHLYPFILLPTLYQVDLCDKDNVVRVVVYDSQYWVRKASTASS